MAARPSASAKADAIEYLAALQVGRVVAALEPGEAGGISTPWSGGAPDLTATVQAVPGALGLDLTRLPSAGGWAKAPRTYGATPPATAAGVGGWGASWLAGQVDADAVGVDKAAWTVLALAADRTGRDAATDVYATLWAARASYASDPAALGQATLAALALGRTSDAKELARLLRRTLSSTPRPTLASPKARTTKAKKARVLTGQSRPGPYAVSEVCVSAVQQRAVRPGAKRTRWFSFQASSTAPGQGDWRKRKSRAVALKRSSQVCVAPVGTAWSAKLPGVTRGRLVVRWSAADVAGARSVTKQRVVTVGRPKAKR